MAYLTRSLLKSRKAQFFVLSAFAIVSILFIISQWVEPFRILDASSAVLDEEIFIFNNVKEQTISVVKNSKSCDDLKFNLDEFKSFIENYFLQKNLNLVFNYNVETPCNDLILRTSFYLALISPKTTIDSSFTVTR